jgi:hypothetical protein
MDSQDIFITDSSLLFFENFSVFYCVLDNKHRMALLNPDFQKTKTQETYYEFKKNFYLSGRR